MIKGAVLLMAIPIAFLTACGGGGSKHPAAAPVRTVTVTPTPSPSATLDNYAEIACTDIDKARAAYTHAGDGMLDGSPNTGLQATTTAIESYDSAVIAASKSTADGFTTEIAAFGADNDATTGDPTKFQNALDGWRSFCESKGWVGTP